MKRSLSRGFSLIEAAIVLGIVGLVIGGIWVAASSINAHMRFGALQRFYIGALDFTAGIRKTITGVTNLDGIIASQPFTKEYVRDSGSGYYVGPGHTLHLVSEGPTLRTFMTFTKVDPSVCLKFSLWLLNTKMPATHAYYIAWTQEDTTENRWYLDEVKPTLANLTSWCETIAGITLDHPL